MKITLTTQTILLSALLGGILTMQAAGEAGADPYSDSSPREIQRFTEEEQFMNQRSGFISLCYEVFSLPLAQAAAYRREQIPDVELYKRLVGGLKAGGVKQEIFTTVCATSGQQARNEAVQELIYPTEYEKDSLPSSLGLGLSAAPVEPDKTEKASSNEAKPEITRAQVADPAQLAATTPIASLAGLERAAHPTAFETRPLGETLEVEVTLGDNDNWAHITLVPEQVVFVGNSTYGKGFNEVTMPEFETRRINTSLSVQLGKPRMVGTFNRSTKSKVDPDSANRVSYAFITVTFARP